MKLEVPSDPEYSPVALSLVKGDRTRCMQRI